MQVLNGHTSRVNDLAFSLDGRHLASCSTDGTIRLWDCVTGSGDVLHRIQRVPPDELGYVGFVANGNLVIRPRWQPMQVWDVRKRVPVATLTEALNPSPGWFAVSPAGDLVAAQERTWNPKGVAIRVWKAETWQQVARHDLPNNLRLTGLAFDPTGARLATAAGILDSLSGALLAGTRFGGDTLAWSPDRRFIAKSVCRSPWVAIRCAESGERLRTLNLAKRAVQDFAFSPDGRWLAVVSNEETVRVWDTHSWEERHTLTWGIGKLKCIAFSADGTRAACGSHNGTILVWDWE